MVCKKFILEIDFTNVDLAQANLNQEPMKIVLTSQDSEVTGNVEFKSVEYYLKTLYLVQ